MVHREPNKVLLTFDVEGQPPREDYFDKASLACLLNILDLLEECGLEGIFFITASAAEKIRRCPDIVDRLDQHCIGYHSSSHSVKPKIIEYTDLASYEEAVAISLKRETSHINPQTGEIEGPGGILALGEAFPKKDITCFRAPFLGWSPPHLEALKKLGIKYDFSANITDCPVSYKGITFYPRPIEADGIVRTFVRKEIDNILPRPVESILLRKKVTVLSIHPSTLLVKKAFVSRGKYIISGRTGVQLKISMLKLLFKKIRFLQKAHLIEVTSSLSQNWQHLHLEKIDVERIYWQSVQNLMRLFNCNPRFILSHFTHFFEQDPC